LQPPTHELEEFLCLLQEKISDIPLKNQPRAEKINLICGADISYRDEEAVAVAVLWSLNEKKVIDIVIQSGEPPFPYIPGLLFMRESPLLIPAIKKLSHKPDIILVNGHGIAHPRRAGLAVFVGLGLNIPTIGYAKRILVGTVEENEKEITPLLLDSRLVGLRIKKANRPFFVSPGFGVDIDSLRNILKLIGEEYPEVLLAADQISKEHIKK
jgi:deoxyribonuclease V